VRRHPTPVLAVCLTLTLAAVHAPAAESLEDFAIITRRNVFDPDRRPEHPNTRPAEFLPPPEPPAPPETISLLGVALTEERATAVFNGSTPELSGTRTLGETIADLVVVDLDTREVVLRPRPAGTDDRGDDSTELRLPVGGGLSRQGRESTWKRAEVRPVPDRSAPARGAEPDHAGPEEAGDESADRNESDILKRLRERRQRELEK
jgi:hypothetical protein